MVEKFAQKRVTYKPLSVKNISVDSRTCAASQWAITVAPTLSAAAVRELTLLFVTDRDYSLVK